MATLDESVANLQKFIAHLVASTGALEKSTDHFKQSGQRFGELEDETAEQGGGLNDELDDLGAALDSGLPGAESALAELTQAATDGQGTTGEAQQRLDEAASTLEGRAEKTLDELADGNARLAAEGFDALGRTLDASQKDLQSKVQEGEQEFTRFDEAVVASQGEAAEAWTAAETALDEATSELGQEGSALEASVDEGVHGFDSGASEFEQHCTELASDVDEIYDALDAAVGQQGQEWQQHVDTLARQASASVERGAEERLEQPAKLVEVEALGALEQEYSTLAGVLDGGGDTAGQLEPLAEDLARCQGVLVQVDALLNAIAE